MIFRVCVFIRAINFELFMRREPSKIILIIIYNKLFVGRRLETIKED